MKMNSYFRSTAILFLISLVGTSLAAQPAEGVIRPPANTHQKVKVMILGMFHFASRSDRIKVPLDDMMSEQRQNEIGDLDQSLLNFRPDRVFVEWEPTRQTRVDSQYTEYLNGRFTLQANEVYQVGFRLAKEMHLPTVYCMDAPGNYLFDTLVSTAKRSGQGEWFEKYNDSVAHLVLTLDSLERGLPVKERLRRINSVDRIMQSHMLNAGVTTAPYLGSPGEYSGAEFMSEWYKRNIRMYTNVVRLLQPADTAILIIVGAGHARILKHFFEDNPAFDVIDATRYLN